MVAIVCGAGAGCFEPDPPTPEQMLAGYIMLLPGVECMTWSMRNLMPALTEAGITQAVDLVTWGEEPFGAFRNLLSYEENRDEAARLAERLVRYSEDYPDRPISIIGYSGGAGIALFVAEALPADFMIDRMILLGPAVSPEYDLGPALAHCRNGLINFYGEPDVFTLDWGTSIFGTMDRVKTVAAGKIGFLGSDGALLQRPGLTQVVWRPAWCELGHCGGHDGWIARTWVRQVLAAYLPGGSGVPSEVEAAPQTLRGPCVAGDE